MSVGRDQRVSWSGLIKCASILMDISGTNLLIFLWSMMINIKKGCS